MDSMNIVRNRIKSFIVYFASYFGLRLGKFGLRSERVCPLARPDAASISSNRAGSSAGIESNRWSQSFNSVRGQFTHLSARCAACITDFENARQVIQAETQRQCAADHPHAIHGVCWIFTIAAGRPARLQQALALIMPQGVGTNAGRLRQFADSQRGVSAVPVTHKPIIKSGTGSRVKRQNRIFIALPATLKKISKEFQIPFKTLVQCLS
jgi:hypothetical protein